MTKLILGLCWWVMSVPALAFIPPVGSIVKDVFGDRRAGIGMEAHLKHRLLLRANEWVDIDEKIIRDSSGTYFVWRLPAYQPQPIAGTYEKQAYWLSKEKSFPTRSTVFWKYFVATDDEIRDALLTERFIRRDHFYQYKPGFNPSGDPQTWGTKENYLRHDDIFLTRLPAVAIAIRGYQEGNTARSVFFDQGLKGMLRLEWKDNDVVAGWNFEAFSKSPWDKALLPKRAQLEINKTSIIMTDVVAVRALKDRALFEAKSTWKGAAKNVPSNQNVDAALKLLVSYR